LTAEVTGVIKLRPDVAWQDLDGEVVALDLESAAYLMANHSGSALWPLLAEGATESQLCAELTSRFPIEPERARADVGAFVGQLRKLDLLD
jgi:hypothetical protein